MINNQEIQWDFVSCYLAGPIDYAKDSGVGWRLEITDKLIKMGFAKHNIFDPTSKPYVSGGQSLSDEQKLMHKYREQKNWKNLEELMGQIMAVDLRLVDKSDILIVNMDGIDKTVGTIHEIVLAKIAHKPVYLIEARGKEHVSAWLMKLVGHERIFSSIDEVVEELTRIKLRGPWTTRDHKEYKIFDLNRKDFDE